MALSEHQVAVLRILADRRKAEGESYVAGGVALNQGILDIERVGRVQVQGCRFARPALWPL